MQARKVQEERPLNGAERFGLALTGVGMIAVCYAFSILSIVALLVVLAVEFLVVLAVARFGLASKITPYIRRVASLLSIFIRSYWMQKGPEYRLILNPEDAPRLFVALKQLSGRFGIPVPREVSIEMNANASVRLKGYRQGSGGTLLTVGYDLLAGLSEGEVQAVLGHEMGHAKFIQRGIRRWLGAGVSNIGRSTSQLSMQVESYRSAGKRFRLAEMFLNPSDTLTRVAARLLATYSRQDEFEADRISAELFGASSMRSALVKLSALDARLRRLPWTERVAQLETQSSFSQWLSAELAANPAETTFEDQGYRDPYSTHPSLRDRIAALPADDGRQPATAPAIALLAQPDKVAAKLMTEVHRILAEQEQKDSKSLAKWARKNRRGLVRTPLARVPAIILLSSAFLLPFVPLVYDRVWTALFLFIGLMTAGACAWRWGGYRDRVELPVPRFADIKKAWQAGRPADIAEQENSLEVKLKERAAAETKKNQKVSFLINEGLSALDRCEYLKAHVAARLAIELNNKCVEAALVHFTAAAGLGLWNQLEQNLEFVRKCTGLSSLSTTWGAGWALFLAGDWGRAESFLWQALEMQPRNPTFLSLLALAQAQRGKLQSAVLNAQKAAELQPDREHTKLLARLLLDAGRLREAEKKLKTMESSANSDAEIAMLMVRLRLMRHQWDAALEATDLLRKADDSPRWLIRLGEEFEAARQDIQAGHFYDQALSVGHYPEALVGLARLAANRRQKEEARRYLLLALDLEKTVGPEGRTALELFQVIVGQMTMLEEPTENCTAWIAAFPPNAVPAALSERSLMLYAAKWEDAVEHLKNVVSALAPSAAAANTPELKWREAPRDQQPARPVRPGVQFVL